MGEKEKKGEKRGGKKEEGIVVKKRETIKSFKSYRWSCAVHLFFKHTIFKYNFPRVQTLN